MYHFTESYLLDNLCDNLVTKLFQRIRPEKYERNITVSVKVAFIAKDNRKFRLLLESVDGSVQCPLIPECYALFAIRVFRFLWYGWRI